MEPFISIIIPVKNGGATLKQCLSAIFNQTLIKQLEVIIIDSGSTDNSLDIISQFPVKLQQISSEKYNHGTTRNLGVSLAKGELIYFTVQDAWLMEINHLEIMSAHFTDQEVQGVVGMQATPHEIDKNPFKWFKRITEPIVEIRHFQNNEFNLMTKKEQHKQSFWDNVNAMYRRSAIEKIKFVETDYAEDWIWANTALKKNHKLIFDPSLVVYHYHHQNFYYAFRVAYTINYNFYKYFNVLPSIPAWFIPNIKAIYHLYRNKNLTIMSKLYWIRHNIASNTGNALSHTIFRITYFFYKGRGLSKTYTIFCKKIPQGRTK